MRIEDFNERLKQGILVCDGAMGSLLYDAVGQQRSVDELNSTHSEAVFRFPPSVYRGRRAAH
jgi:methionine synthase I (cobalamin-dependent)